MSSETPAAHLARLKVSYPAWSIWKGAATGSYWAAPPPGHPHGELICAPTPGELEAKLSAAGRQHDG